MNVYKNISALKYIIMCVNNWGLVSVAKEGKRGEKSFRNK